MPDPEKLVPVSVDPYLLIEALTLSLEQMTERAEQLQRERDEARRDVRDLLAIADELCDIAGQPAVELRSAVTTPSVRCGR